MNDYTLTHFSKTVVSFSCFYPVHFNPFPNKPWFLWLLCKSFENTVERGEIARKYSALSLNDLEEEGISIKKSKNVGHMMEFLSEIEENIARTG